MDAPQPSLGGDVPVVPVLTANPQAMREALIRQLDADADGLRQALRHRQGWLEPRIPKHRRDYARQCVKDIREMVALLDQIGWR